MANGGLRRLTCDKDDITVVIAGKVHMLSALDHLFEFTGKRVRIVATGEISGPGVYHTTNSDDPAQQWRPSLIRVTGEGSVVEATNLKNAPTVGLWVDASHCDAVVTHKGGPAADPGGTVLFAAYVGSPTGASRDLNRVRLRTRLGDDGGKLLTGVFSAGKDNDFSGLICDGAWQHAGYAYGDNPTFDNHRIDGVVQAAAIQHFGRGFRALGGTVKNSHGALALNDATGARVAGIEAVTGMKNGMSVSTSIFANPATDVIEDLSIAECHLRADKTLAARNSTLNITLNTPFVGITIANSRIHAGPHADLVNVFGRASISVGVLDTAVGPGRELSIVGNHIYDSDEYAVLVQRVTDGQVDGNRIRNANSNISFGTSAVRFRKCDRVSFAGNTVRDVRGSPYTELMLLATTGDTNTAIACYDNNAVGLALGAQTRLAVLPTFGGSINTRTSRNRVDGHMPIARITFPTATTTKTFTSVDHAAIAGIRSGADVWLEPYGLGSAEQQQGAHRIYVKTVAAGSVTLETYDAGNTTASCAFNLCWAQ